MASEQASKQYGSAERDLIALGIATAAIFLFVATGGTVVPSVIHAIFSGGDGPDKLLANALLLNIALIIFGWRRYRQLMHEIGERKRAEEQARQLAELDPLTGCLNRRSMSVATETTQAIAKQRDQNIAYIMLDVDNFKQINDMRGHTVGDQLMVELARRLRDLLPQDAPLARLGGDEFAFVVPFDPSKRERIDDLVIRVFEHVATPFKLAQITLDVTVSIGVTTDQDVQAFNPLSNDAGALMHRADIAMYHAKKEGKNRYFWFEPTMENELRFRNELEIGIRRGLNENEFVPYYEQQIDLETGDLVGFEMLARWHSPQLGVVSPELFIPIAEEIGLITELSDQLMAQAFDDAREWDETLNLSINISPVQLRDPWFAQKLLKMLVAHNFPAQRLEIEITESCLHDNIGMVHSMITSLRNQGVQISLDDFGTGYSSLEQLRTLPFDRLKIDRSFISELREPGANSKVVDAIVSLGRGLDMPITAEGIEDEEILRSLRTMGRLKGQGYLYGKPETAAQVRERLRLSGRIATAKPNPELKPARAKQTGSAEEHVPDWRRSANL
ncbi:MAG: EAL domain-containing protein [Pseudomonadota bacterium]